MEGLVVSESTLVVVIPPSTSNRIPEAVLRELSSHLFTFNEIFGGVLAYDVQIVGKKAAVLRDILPHVCIRLTEGTVVKLTPESIHVVVLGFTSAVVVDEDIRQELEYVSRHDGEVFRSKYHEHHVIKVGVILRFQVKSLDEEIIHICSSLAAAWTGSVKWLEKGNVETQMQDSTKSGEKTSPDAPVGGKELDYIHSVKRSKNKGLPMSCNGSKWFSTSEEGYLTYNMIELEKYYRYYPHWTKCASTST